MGFPSECGLRCCKRKTKQNNLNKIPSNGPQQTIQRAQTVQNHKNSANEDNLYRTGLLSKGSLNTLQCTIKTGMQVYERAMRKQEELNESSRFHTGVRKHSHLTDTYSCVKNKRPSSWPAKSKQHQHLLNTDWSSIKKDLEAQPIAQDDSRSTASLDEAFSVIMQFMSETTKQCKRFYQSKNGSLTKCERRHCCRFHASPSLHISRPISLKSQVRSNTDEGEQLSDITKAHTRQSKTLPKQMNEEPRSYILTAFLSGSHTEHQVHVETGQKVELNFC